MNNALLRIRGNIQRYQLELHLLNLRRAILQVELDELRQQERQAAQDRRRRRWWVHPVNLLREDKGYYNNLMRELEANDWEGFYGLMRMYPDFFH